MNRLTKSGKKSGKMKVLSIEDQAKIRGGKELPEWLKKLVNAQED